MDSLYSTMNQQANRKHLSFEELGYYSDAFERWLFFACNYSGTQLFTFYYQLRRQTWHCKAVSRKVKRYKAAQGHGTYQTHRKNCGRESDFLKKTKFIRYVHKHFFEDGWSFNICKTITTDNGLIRRFISKGKAVDDYSL